MTDGECSISAAILTAACLGNAPSSITISADGIIDQATKAKDLYEWSVYKIFWNAISQVGTDPQDWPVPVVPPGGSGPHGGPGGGPSGPPLAVLQGLVGVLAGSNPTVAALIQQAIAILGGANPVPPAPTANIPAPGVVK